MLTREEAIELVKKHDHDLDKLAVKDFIDFTGYTEEEFYNIIDSLYNRDLFKKDEFGRWVLKTEIR